MENPNPLEPQAPPQQPPESPPQVPPVPAVDPHDYETVLQQNEQMRGILLGLEPYAQIVQRAHDDPEVLKLYEQAYNTYTQYRKEQEPPVPPEQRPLYDKVSKLEKIADDWERQRKDEAERPQRERAEAFDRWKGSRENELYFQRLMKDHPTLQQRDFHYLASFAQDNNFADPLEAVWKQHGWRVLEGHQQAPPPSSLRTDAGEPGTAGGAPTQSESMRDFIVRDLKAQRGIAS